MYLLDTNILSELMRRQPNPQVEARFASEPGELFASAITVEEIRCGARIGPPGNRLWQRAEADLFPHLTVLALDQPVAVMAGDLRAEWKRSGTPVGYSDGLIAATAKHFGLTLVTRNVRHFDHVPGLSVEDWFEQLVNSRWLFAPGRLSTETRAGQDTGLTDARPRTRLLAWSLLSPATQLLKPFVTLPTH